MKKSRHVASLLRSAGVVVLMLPVAACDSKERTVGTEDVKIYSSVDACAKDEDPAACRAAAAQAQADHRNTAPRYTSAEDCRAGWQACEQVSSPTGSFFMPALMGFMVGRMLSNNGGYAVRPGAVYTDRDGYASTTDRRLGRASVPSAGGAAVVRAPVTAGGEIGARSAIVSRGGFGGAGEHFSAGS